MAVSELCWLQPDPPEECRQYFANEYPAMVDIDTNVATIKNCGYDLLGQFTLPESAWKASYYRPLEDRLQLFRKKYATDPERMEMIDSVQMEIDLYRKYAGYYGYVFFMMQHGQRKLITTRIKKIVISAATCAINGANIPLDTRLTTPNITPYMRTIRKPTRPFGKPTK